MEGWMNKENGVYIHNRHTHTLHRHTKKWNLAICDNINGSKSKEGRQKPYNFTSKWNLKKKNKQKHIIGIEDSLVVSRGKEVMKLVKWMEVKHTVMDGY